MSSIEEINREIEKVDKEIGVIQTKIDDWEKDESKKNNFSYWETEKKQLRDKEKQLRDKEKQLRDEKKQLRDKEKQLRDEKKQLRDKELLLLQRQSDKSHVIRFCIKENYHYSLKDALKIANDYLVPDCFDSVLVKFQHRIDRKTLAQLVPKVDIKFEKSDMRYVSPNKDPSPDAIPLFLYCARTAKEPVSQENLTIYLNEAFRDRVDRIRPEIEEMEKKAQQTTEASTASNQEEMTSQKRLNYLEEYKTIVLYLALIILHELGHLIRIWCGFDKTPDWVGKEAGNTVEKEIFGRKLYFGFIMDENDPNNFDTYGLTTEIICSVFEAAEGPSESRKWIGYKSFWAPIKQSYIDKVFAYSIESGSGSRNEMFWPICSQSEVESMTFPPKNVRYSKFKSCSDAHISASSSQAQQATPISATKTRNRLVNTVKINTCWCPTMLEDYKFIDLGLEQIKLEDFDEIIDIEENELEAILNSSRS